MRPLRVVLAVGVLVLILPSSVLAQVKTFNFSWYTECQTRNGVSGNQANAGLATLTPSASGGWQLRFSGPGTATGSAASSATARASASWDSRTVGDGAHTLRVAVTDGFGSQLAFGEVTVTVANGGGGTTTPPPTTGTLRVAVTSPHDGDVVSGTSWVVIWVNGGTAGASDTYTLQLDGQTVATASTTSSGPVSMAWNTKAFLNGTHTLSATVRDNAGKTGSAKLGVLIRN